MNYKIIFLIVALIIPFLIWGPFFPDLIVSISSLLFIYYVIKNKEYKFFKNTPLKVFFIFCGYCIFCSLFSKDILLSLQSSLFYFRIGIFACVIWYLIDKDVSIIKYFYYTLSICFLVLIFDSFFQYIFEKNIVGLPIIGGIHSGRISSFFGDELIMGSYLSRLLPLWLAFHIIKKKKKFDDYFIFLILVSTGIAIFLSGERTAFFFYGMTIIVSAVLIKSFQKLIIISLLTSSVIMGIIAISNPTIQERMISKFFSIIDLNEKHKKFSFSNSHDAIYITAYKMFKEKPLIGHGPKMFRVMNSDPKYYINKASLHPHPHNFYIQLLAETGIIGFSFLFSFLFYIFYCFYRQIKSIIFKQKKYLTEYQVCLVIGMLITVWPFSPNGNFFNNWLAIVYSFPIGFYLHSIYGSNKL